VSSETIREALQELRCGHYLEQQFAPQLCTLFLQGKRGEFTAPVRIHICRVRIAEWVVLAEHQGYERNGEAWKHFHHPSPIFTELAY
jgi:hypothetical protein